MQEKYPWFIEDCPCIDCECVRLGINPLSGEVMHNIWIKQEENYDNRKKLFRKNKENRNYS